jgi:hypothetical protein
LRDSTTEGCISPQRERASAVELTVAFSLPLALLFFFLFLLLLVPRRRGWLGLR